MSKPALTPEWKQLIRFLAEQAANDIIAEERRATGTEVSQSPTNTEINARSHLRPVFNRQTARIVNR